MLKCNYCKEPRVLQKHYCEVCRVYFRKLSDKRQAKKRLYKRMIVTACKRCHGPREKSKMYCAPCREIRNKIADAKYWKSPKGRKVANKYRLRIRTWKKNKVNTKNRLITNLGYIRKAKVEILLEDQ